MSEQAPPIRKKTDWHDVRQKTISGVIATVILGILGGVATLIWNVASQGGLVRALGGITQAELESTVKRATIPGPPGPQGQAGPIGPVGPSAELPKGMVVAFRSDCPSGWSTAKEAIGSAIVGAWGMRASADASPPATMYSFDPPATYLDDIPIHPATKGSQKTGTERVYVPPKTGVERGYDPFKPGTTYGSGQADKYGSANPTFEPADPYYLVGEKSNIAPSYLPLHYCRKD